MLLYRMIALSTCTPQQIKNAKDIPGKAWVDGTWDPCVVAALLTDLKTGPKQKKHNKHRNADRLEGRQYVVSRHLLLDKNPQMPSTFVGTFDRKDVERMRRRLKQWLAKPDFTDGSKNKIPAGKDTGLRWMAWPLMYKSDALHSLLTMFNTVLERGSNVTLNLYAA